MHKLSSATRYDQKLFPAKATQQDQSRPQTTPHLMETWSLLPSMRIREQTLSFDRFPVLLDFMNPGPYLYKLQDMSKTAIAEGRPNGFDTLLSVIPKMVMKTGKGGGGKLMEALNAMLTDVGVGEIVKARIRETKIILLQ